MKYVYLLESISNPDRYDTSLADDVAARLRAHNSGQVRHTAKFKPWRFKTFEAFSNAERAIAFENISRAVQAALLPKSAFKPRDNFDKTLASGAV